MAAAASSASVTPRRAPGGTGRRPPGRHGSARTATASARTRRAHRPGCARGRAAARWGGTGWRRAARRPARARPRAYRRVADEHAARSQRSLRVEVGEPAQRGVVGGGRKSDRVGVGSEHLGVLSGLTWRPRRSSWGLDDSPATPLARHRRHHPKSGGRCGGMHLLGACAARCCARAAGSAVSRRLPSRSGSRRCMGPRRWSRPCSRCSPRRPGRGRRRLRSVG